MAVVGPQKLYFMRFVTPLRWNFKPLGYLPKKKIQYIFVKNNPLFNFNI
jgi:hypothetical protein